MYRNVANQKIRVYAYNVTTGLPVTGDADNITAVITKDDGTPAPSNDTNPAEVDDTNEKGYYDFDMTQAESNAGKISFTPQSSTANVVVYTVGGPVIYTRPQYIADQLKIKKYFQLALRSDSAIATDNATELGEINANEGSGSGSYIVGYSLAGMFSTLSTYISGVITLVTTVDTVVDAIKIKTDNLPSDPADQSQIETALDGFATSLNNTITNEIADLSANMATAANLAVVDSVADNINAIVTNATYGLQAFHTNVFTAILGQIAAGVHHPSSGDAYLQIVNSTASLAGLIASVQDKMIKLFQITLRKDSAIIVDRAVELDNINSNSGTGIGSYSPATDSQEAIRDASGGGGGGSTVEDIWSYGQRTLTQPVVVGTVPSSTNLLAIHCGDSYSISITGLGNITNRSKLWFTVKSELDDTDNDAVLQITESGGLIRVNGEVPGSSSLASITVDDATSGDITIALDETLTRLLAVGELKFYDIQVLRSTGSVNTLVQGTLIANDDVTKAVS